MNTIEIETIIYSLRNFPNALGILCLDNPFFDKIARFSVNLFNTEKEKWEGVLKTGDSIRIRGTIAEAKQGKYNAYISIYNPEVIAVNGVANQAIEALDTKVNANDQEQE